MNHSNFSTLLDKSTINSIRCRGLASLIHSSMFSFEFSKPVPKYKLSGSGVGSLGDAVAPMPGVIEKVLVEDGSTVAAGDPLIVMIAMKMEYVIKVEFDKM